MGVMNFVIHVVTMIVKNNIAENNWKQLSNFFVNIKIQPNLPHHLNTN